jgi:hypothetical protein
MSLVLSERRGSVVILTLDSSEQLTQSPSSCWPICPQCSKVRKPATLCGRLWLLAAEIGSPAGH